MNEETASRILRTLPREKMFYFFTSIGNYTGKSAASLKEFMDKINEVDVKSLEFHFYSGDFEKWIAEVLQDEELAEEVRKLRKFNPMGEVLRNQLYATVSKHLKQLTSKLSSAQV